MACEPIVLLHGSATGAYSWGVIRQALVTSGKDALAPDMLGYGRAPAPSASWGIKEEVAHLERWLGTQCVGSFHFVAHSLGAMFALHLRLALGARVSRLTLIDPVVVSVLREPGQEVAFDEIEVLYQRFTRAMPDHAAAARIFVEHWSGAGAWDELGEKARALITALAPRLALEMNATRDDMTPLSALAASPVPTTVLLGENTLLAPRAIGRLLADAFAARTIVVPGAAHMIPLTHPEAVVAALQEKDRA
jgi:pimeloyl-ACP methyl ester carboxylesterase